MRVDDEPGRLIISCPGQRCRSKRKPTLCKPHTPPPITLPSNLTLDPLQVSRLEYRWTIPLKFKKKYLSLSLTFNSDQCRTVPLGGWGQVQVGYRFALTNLNVMLLIRWEGWLGSWPSRHRVTLGTWGVSTHDLSSRFVKNEVQR